jgi:hypothetical protein
MNVADQPSRVRRIRALAFLMIGYFFYAWSWNTVDILRCPSLEHLAQLAA